jgi:hypothetical protein
LIRCGGGAINGAMRKLLLVVGLVVGLAGCWTSSKPASKPQPAEDDASTGGTTYAATLSALGTTQTSGSAWGDLSDSNDGSLSKDGGATLGQVGTTGTGNSGGGTGTGTVGLGKPGVVSHGTSHGTGYGPGGRGAPPPAPSSAVPTVSIGDPTGPSQSLDPAIIRRLIRRNIAKIQYCYEKELVATPGLEGRVNVRFSVGADGKVTQSTGSGMPPVDACVAGVIAAIEFPKPTGGGVVMVNYPFIFQEPKLDPDPAAP